MEVKNPASPTWPEGLEFIRGEPPVAGREAIGGLGMGEERADFLEGVGGILRSDKEIRAARAGRGTLEEFRLAKDLAQTGQPISEDGQPPSGLAAELKHELAGHRLS